jgi:hypothetical protein
MVPFGAGRRIVYDLDPSGLPVLPRADYERVRMPQMLYDLPDGMHFDVPPDVYYEPDVRLFSQSAAEELIKSPAHFRAWLRGSRARDSKAMEFGRAAHMAFLEPERFRRTYVVEPDWGPCRANAELGVSKEEGKANKDRRDAWRAQFPKETTQYVTAEDFASMVGVARSIDRHALASRMLDGGQSEVTLLWTCRETGVRCKARIDHWHESVEMACDFKNLRDSSARAFVRVSREHGYRRQAVHYLRGLATLGLSSGECDKFQFVCAEPLDPYAVDVHFLSDEALAHGDVDILQAKRALAESLATDTWPARPDDRPNCVGLERWETIQHGG